MNEKVFIIAPKIKPYNMGRGTYRRLKSKMHCAYEIEPWHWYNKTSSYTQPLLIPL